MSAESELRAFRTIAENFNPYNPMTPTQTKPAHTALPWYARVGSSPHYQGQIASETTGDTIAITYNDEHGANARLIASAPELLEALQLAIVTINRLVKQHGPFSSAQGTLDVAKAAIAKATGNT